jgi:hypothetical protein
VVFEDTFKVCSKTAWKNERSCLPIDIATPVDLKFETNKSEKLSTDKHMDIEVNRIWEVKTKIVPIMIGALGTIIRDYIRNLSNS